MTNPFVSICIPSYNRPTELRRLLESIPIECVDQLEVVIAEDHAPLRREVRSAVETFRESGSPLDVRYVENEINLGYDGNLRKLAALARGEYVIYMGDDDVFDSAHLADFLQFLHRNSDCAYILKTHSYVHEDGTVEPFVYFPSQKKFPPGVDAFRALFRRSVFISGFCFKREAAAPFHTSLFDGTLLYQLYLLAELVLIHPSIYCPIPLTVQGASLRGLPMFGSSEAEKSLYTPGKITTKNSVNFMNGYLKIARFVDGRHGIGAETFLRHEISKYSYPVIALQRWRGVKAFRSYCAELEEAISINSSVYYYIYYFALLCFGKPVCDRIIVGLKRLIGSTPRL